MSHKSANVVALLILVVACYGAATVGGLAGAGADDGWYAELAKPSWTPPAWVFGPVWTLLYGLMAVAAWLVWLQRGQRRVAVALVLFGVQLGFNAAWSPLFFGLHRPGLAFIDLVLLWGALVATVWAFLRQRPVAGLLLLPYLGWVSFAAVLNLAIWRLNP